MVTYIVTLLGLAQINRITISSKSPAPPFPLSPPADLPLTGGGFVITLVVASISLASLREETTRPRFKWQPGEPRLCSSGGHLRATDIFCYCCGVFLVGSIVLCILASSGYTRFCWLFAHAPILLAPALVVGL
jgi:hypothetical protein